MVICASLSSSSKLQNRVRFNFAMKVWGYDPVMEYVEGNWIFEGCGPPGGIGESVARKYFRDVVAGLSYLHNHVRSCTNLYAYNHNFVEKTESFPLFWFPLTAYRQCSMYPQNVIHGDIKPENLLISGDGSIKICDLGCGRTFEVSVDV